MKFRTITFLALIGILLWFVGVDRIMTVTFCPRCGSNHFQTAIRVAGLWSFTYSEQWDSPHAYLMSCDLGNSCEHRRDKTYIVYRYAGLVWPMANDRKTGIPDVMSLGEYTPADREKVRGFVRENPALAKEFEKRLMEGNWDANYWRQFNLEIRGERPVRTVTRAHILTEREKRDIVEHARDIRWIEFSDNRVWDPNVAVIWAVGEVLAPYLAEKITDTTPSQWLTWATVGDVAYFLLSGMDGGYAVQSKFVELQSSPGEGNPSLNYVDFHRSYLENPDPEVNRKNRLLLQSLWREHIQEREKNNQ
jgi:hypothetical protein